MCYVWSMLCCAVLCVLYHVPCVPADPALQPAAVALLPGTSPLAPATCSVRTYERVKKLIETPDNIYSPWFPASNLTAYCLKRSRMAQISAW